MGTLASGSIDLKSLKVASGEATSYITKIDGGGIKVHDAGDKKNYIQLTSNGMDIYKNINSTPTCVAQFRDEIIIGEERKSCVRITDDGYYINTKGLVPFKVEYEDMTYNEEIFEIGYQLTYENMSTAAGQSVIIDGLDIVVPFSDFTLYATYKDRQETFSRSTSESFTKGVQKETEQKYGNYVLKFSYDGDKTFIFKIVYVGDPLDELPIDATLDRFVWEKLSSFPVMQIGIDGNSHLRMDYHSLQLISKEGDTYFHVSDLRDENGYLTDNFTGDGEENMFTFSVYGCDSVIKVTIDGVEQEQDTYYYFLDHITFNEAPSNNAEIIVIYTVATTKCQALTFGNRKENQSIGIYSIALGDNNSARGICSSAMGRNVTTGGDYSLAIGNSISAMGRGTIATGIDAREQVQIGTSYNAQGAIVGGYISSLAKSNSYITNGGKGSIVVGCIEDGGDMGSSSFGTAALGIGTWALGKGQTVIGTFNSLDTQGNTSNHPKNTDPAYTKYAFIIGNGYYDTTNDEEIRSNALTVDWNGNVNTAGRVTSVGLTSSGTISTSSTISATGNINTSGSFTMSGSKLLKVVATTKDNVSITKENTGNGTFTVSTQSGYTPVGIVGFDLSNAPSGTGVHNCVPLQFELNGSTVSWQIRNNASSTVKIQIQIYILYAKTGLI